MLLLLTLDRPLRKGYGTTFGGQECVNKAKALFRAAEEAKRFASAARRGQ